MFTAPPASPAQGTAVLPKDTLRPPRVSPEPGGMGGLRPRGFMPGSVPGGWGLPAPYSRQQAMAHLSAPGQRESPLATVTKAEPLGPAGLGGRGRGAGTPTRRPCASPTAAVLAVPGGRR